MGQNYHVQAVTAYQESKGFLTRESLAGEDGELNQEAYSDAVEKFKSFKDLINKDALWIVNDCLVEPELLKLDRLEKFFSWLDTYIDHFHERKSLAESSGDKVDLEILGIMNSFFDVIRHSFETVFGALKEHWEIQRDEIKRFVLEKCTEAIEKLSPLMESDFRIRQMKSTFDEGLAGLQK